MKAKRILSLLLAVITVFGAMAVLSSCGKGDNVKLSAKTVDVDLTGYAVVYADVVAKTRLAQSMMAEVADLVAERTNDSTMARAFSKTKSTAADPEILIGQTTRAQSQKALGSIKGDGFTIQVIDNKIVIVGTSTLLTLQAVNYFTQNYLQGGEGKAVTVNATVKANKVKTVRLVGTDAEPLTTFVYDDKLHDDVAHPDPTFVGTYSGRDMSEYPVQAINSIIEKLSSTSGWKTKLFKSAKDNEEIDGAKFYVGAPDVDDVKALRATLEGNEFGVFVKDGNFVLTAWSDAALIAGHDSFLQLLEEATLVDGDKKYVEFPEGFSLIAVSNTEWIVDFPKPEGEGVDLYNTYDTSNNSLQYLYKGEGVNEAAFKAYCEKLDAAGYALLQENEIEGSLYATYHNAEKEHMLYVAYNAFTHADEYGPFDGWYASSYGEKLLRIVSMPTNDEFCVPDKNVLKAQNYTKVTDTAVTAVGLGKGAVGMGYIVTLEDGSFIIFDGGAMGESAQEHVQIWDIMFEQYKSFNNGQEPTAQKPLRIAAWVITHSHGDHYGVPRKVLQTYGKDGRLTMDYLIGNFGAAGSFYPVYNDDSGRMGTPGVIKDMQSVMKTPFKFIKAHSGQKYYFANVEMEVLMTYDDHNPNPIINTNDTNTVVRFKTTSQDAKSADPYTMVWLGDANQRQSRYLCAMYGSYLESDLVQLAHHGNVGSESALYDTIKASVVLFPHNWSAYLSYTNPANKGGTYCYGVDYRIVYENPATEYVIVSEPGLHATFKIVGCQPVYSFYCAKTGEAITPTTDKAAPSVGGIGFNVLKVK